MATTPTRLRAFFALDDDWERPRPGIGRSDVVLAATLSALALVSLELVRAGAVLIDVGAPLWVQRVVTASAGMLLVGRRRWPLTTALLAATHMFVVGVTLPAVMSQLVIQIVYFFALFSGVAWARNRATMLIVVGAIVAFMFAWLSWQFALGNSVETAYGVPPGDRDADALLTPVTSAIALLSIVNLIFFGGAFLGGQASWRRARQQARLEEQAATIAAQAEELSERAVVAERLRIARELHDVVAHHVSVIGIQAAAGRRVLDRDPEATRESLGQVEASSREALAQMRGLLGALRDLRSDRPEEGANRDPVPGLHDLAALVGERTSPRLTVTYSVVESLAGATRDVPGALGLALYRATQEALTNVVRHSTATAARVVLRVDPLAGGGGFAEVEVTDDGRARPHGTGTGMGQLGIRERAAAHGGTVEIGPRPTGGYRVRVRLPLVRDVERAPV